MQTNNNTITETKQDREFATVAPEQQYSSNRNLYGLGTNYTSANKWYAYLPLENVLGKKYQNLDLHLKAFALPQLIMGSTTAAFKGYQREVPTKVLNAENKELTLTYVVDENWHNYKALYAWISSPEGTLNPIVKDEVIQKISPSEYIPLRIYLLDNYKRKVIQFVFEQCWIKIFQDLQLDMNNTEEISHSFTFCYSQYHIEEIG